MSSLVPPLVFSLPFPLVCVSCHPSPCVCHHSHVLSCLPSVCVRQGTCTVCVLLATHQHSALLSSFLSCLLFLSLFHHHHPHSWGHQRVKGVWGKRGKRKKRGVSSKKACKKAAQTQQKEDDTWCSHLVSNPCPNHALSPFTSLITPQVVLSSWCGRHCFSKSTHSFFTSTQEVSGLCDVKQPHKSATPFLVPTLFLLFPLSSCHFTSLLPLCSCDECPSPIHPTNVSKPCVSHPHFLLVPCVCAVVSTLTTAPSHSLIVSSIGCPMCGDCLFPWRCVVWLSVESAGRQ